MLQVIKFNFDCNVLEFQLNVHVIFYHVKLIAAESVPENEIKQYSGIILGKNRND